mmetsp:Transcript_778/g.2281  ORF Transcript_778/g.2281 Transcript_778/m.2281 type:complete len:282 (+) Transcript_778:172-1017(+)
MPRRLVGRRPLDAQRQPKDLKAIQVERGGAKVLVPELQEAILSARVHVDAAHGEVAVRKHGGEGLVEQADDLVLVDAPRLDVPHVNLESECPRGRREERRRSRVSELFWNSCEQEKRAAGVKIDLTHLPLTFRGFPLLLLLLRLQESFSGQGLLVSDRPRRTCPGHERRPGGRRRSLARSRLHLPAQPLQEEGLLGLSFLRSQPLRSHPFPCASDETTRLLVPTLSIPPSAPLPPPRRRPVAVVLVPLSISSPTPRRRPVPLPAPRPAPRPPTRPPPFSRP